MRPHARRGGSARWSRDVAATPGAADARSPGVGAYVGVPVRLGDGTVYGSLCCVSREPAPGLADRDARMLEVLARIVADQIELAAPTAAAPRGCRARRSPARRCSPRSRRASTTPPSTPRRSVGIATAVARGARARRARGDRGRPGRAAARHRQARGAGRDPAEARLAVGGGVADHARAPRHGRARRGLDPVARPPGARGPGRARALGRPRLPGRPRRRGDPARQPHLPGLRRVARDDLRPPVPRARWARARRGPS